MKSNVNSRQGVSLPYLDRDMTAECSANAPLDRMEIVRSYSLNKFAIKSKTNNLIKELRYGWESYRLVLSPMLVYLNEEKEK